MNNLNPLVSVIIPAKNSGKHLNKCLSCIKNQTYKRIEIIVVDSNSQDNTKEICQKYKTKIFHFSNPKLLGKFDATFKRNLGAQKAKGKYVYYVDADMRLIKNVISQAVFACEKEDYDAVIVKEIVVGSGFLTKCRHLEQECYWGDDNIEAPRFFKKNVWKKLKGLDSKLGAGCDDWDLYQRFLQQGYKAKRIKAPLYHNEGKINLKDLIKKSFMYGKDVTKFIKKSPKKSFMYFFPIRPAYIRHWKLFVKNPHLGFGLILIRTIEYSGGAIGIIYNKISQTKIK